jgi:hypothetical protein
MIVTDTPKINRSSSEAAWHLRAEEEASWTLARLVNRRDAWGEYRLLEEVGRPFTRADGTTGTLGEQRTRKGYLSLPRLVRHFRATGRTDIVGLHPADRDNQAKWGALDLDQHEDDPVRAEANRLAALHWHGELFRRGFRPLLTTSNGKGGYHLRVLLAEAIDAARLFHFLRRLTADHRTFGLAAPPERFPKQPDVRRCGKGFGNWLRLFGRHHKRDYWSEVWDGTRSLAGHEAIDYLLALPGDDPALVPDVPKTTPPSSPRRTCSAGNNLSAQIAAYMRRLPNKGAGEGRDDIAFNFAAWLVRDMALDDDIALQWLELWDRGNNPPKGRDCLDAILKNAHAYGQRSRGCGRRPDPPQYDRHGHIILESRR